MSSSGGNYRGSDHRVAVRSRAETQRIVDGRARATFKLFNRLAVRLEVSRLAVPETKMHLATAHLHCRQPIMLPQILLMFA
jgi:hypothetical protein